MNELTHCEFEHRQDARFDAHAQTRIEIINAMKYMELANFPLATVKLSLCTLSHFSISSPFRHSLNQRRKQYDKVITSRYHSNFWPVLQSCHQNQTTEPDRMTCLYRDFALPQYLCTASGMPR